MLFCFLRALARIRVTVAYAVVLTGVTTALVALGPRAQSRVISHASTNLHNLSHGHLGTLFVSAFVIDAGPIYVWLPGLICLLATAELLWRSGRLVTAFAIGHVGATLLIAVGLTAAVESGWSSTDVTRATDVGMSYGALAVLGSLTAAIPRRWRPAWVGWWIAAAASMVLRSGGFTASGHAVALILGMLLSTRFGQAARWTRALSLLLLIASAFGFLMMAGDGFSVMVASAFGAFGAAVFTFMARYRRVRRSATQTSHADAELTPEVA